MNKNIMYEELYVNMVKGVYNGWVRSFENNLEPTSEILVSKVKKACDDRDVDFDDFLNYARDRKKGEESE